MKRILLKISGCFLLLLFSFCMPESTDFDSVRERFIAEALASPINEQAVEKLMRSVQDDGSWDDINYVDVSRTGFQNVQHLNRLIDMARAYRKQESALRKSQELKTCIDKVLDFWLKKDFICENWWHNEIGTPSQLVSFLLIMDEELSKEQVKGTLKITNRAHLDAPGARPSGDRIKIAGILARSLLFQRNESEFYKVVRVIEGEIKFTTVAGPGLHCDYSFQHRTDGVNNTLTYGSDYADVFAEWAAKVSGTKYAFSEKSLKLLTDYYLDGICRMMAFGKYPDAGARNREISRRNSMRKAGNGTPNNLLKASDYRKDELEEIVAIRNDKKESALSYAASFWRSDYFSFQRQGFFTSVRMFSSRNHNMEVPYNGEGLLNYFLGDGSNFTSKSGNEYFNIAPVLDWRKIPGTTLIQKPDFPSKDLQQKGLTDFVGSATDGRYGLAVFDYKGLFESLSAKKAWFFFDKEYVCLGAGITSNESYQVATTLSQCLLHDEVVIADRLGERTVTNGDHKLKGVSRISHGGISYYFSKPSDIMFSNTEAKGSWFDINGQSQTSKQEVVMPVFKLWLEHGEKPENAGYEYIVAFDKNSQPQQIEILSNTTAIQAVNSKELNITQIVFYSTGELTIAENLTVGLDKPGLLMVQTDGSNIKGLTIADPTQKLKNICVTISTKLPGETWNEQKGVSELQIELPQNCYAGKSIVKKY